MIAIRTGQLDRVIFGRYAAAEKRRVFLRVLALVFGLDFATKLLAIALLHEGKQLSLFGGAIELGLVFNSTALGTIARSRSPEFVLGVSAAWLLLSILALAFARAESRLRWKLALISAQVLLVGAVSPFLGHWPYYVVGSTGFTAIRILGSIAFALLVLRLARSRVLFALLSTTTAASLANVVCLFVSPRGVPDFLRVPLLGRLFGVANLADYVMTLGMGLILAFVPLRLAVACMRSLDSLAFGWVDASLGTAPSDMLAPMEMPGEPS